MWDDIFYLDSTSPTGLRWKIKPSVSIEAHTAAGHFTATTGYWTIKYKGERQHLHRVIWALNYGAVPHGMFVDHIDGNKANNDISNLRLASSSENSCNRRLSTRNTTGVKGLTVDTVRGYRYYVPNINKSGTRLKKTFPYTEEGRLEAIEWLKETRLALHGQFTNHGERNELP